MLLACSTTGIQGRSSAPAKGCAAPQVEVFPHPQHCHFEFYEMYSDTQMYVCMYVLYWIHLVLKLKGSKHTNAFIEYVGF